MADFDPVSYIMGAKAGSGGGGGSTTLSGLTDVDISNPANGQTLVYNAESGKWENGAASGGFTLLHGTFSSVEGTAYVTLPITASELYVLMHTALVAFDYTTGDENEFTTLFRFLTTAALDEVSGDITYTFSSNEFNSNGLSATDNVAIFFNW